MISFLSGILVKKSPMEVCVEVAGVGYRVNISLSSSKQLPAEGACLTIYTRHIIRNDAQELFGFATEEERAIFDMLITLPGIGPRIALRILSNLTPQELCSAVVAEDVEYLRKTPGVGKKSAERIVVELKDRIEKIELSNMDKPGGFLRDAVEALVVLGYRKSEATKVASKVFQTLSEKEIPLEQFLREVLKRM